MQMPVADFVERLKQFKASNVQRDKVLPFILLFYLRICVLNASETVLFVGYFGVCGQKFIRRIPVFSRIS